jgi:hypothetical protein
MVRNQDFKPLSGAEKLKNTDYLLKFPQIKKLAR